MKMSTIKKYIGAGAFVARNENGECGLVKGGCWASISATQFSELLVDKNLSVNYPARSIYVVEITQQGVKKCRHTDCRVGTAIRMD